MEDAEIIGVVEAYWESVRAQPDRGLTSPAFSQQQCYRAIVDAAQAELRTRVQQLEAEKESIVRTAVDAIGGPFCERHMDEVRKEPFDVFYAKHVAQGCHRCMAERATEDKNETSKHLEYEIRKLLEYVELFQGRLDAATSKLTTLRMTGGGK